MKYTNEIFPTIYEDVPQPFKQKDFYPCFPALIDVMAQKQEWKMVETDKWHINYN